jgi:hypothetical protein
VVDCSHRRATLDELKNVYPQSTALFLADIKVIRVAWIFVSGSDQAVLNNERVRIFIVHKSPFTVWVGISDRGVRVGPAVEIVIRRIIPEEMFLISVWVRGDLEIIRGRNWIIAIVKELSSDTLPRK